MGESMTFITHNGHVYDRWKQVETTVEDIGMLSGCIIAYCMMYNKDRFILLDVHAEIRNDVWYDVIFTYAEREDWERWCRYG